VGIYLLTLDLQEERQALPQLLLFAAGVSKTPSLLLCSAAQAGPLYNWQ
jgi:hypothetical protein